MRANSNQGGYIGIAGGKFETDTAGDNVSIPQRKKEFGDVFTGIAREGIERNHCGGQRFLRGRK